MDEIKCCPFCGGEPDVMQNWSRKFQCYFLWVECPVCGARGGSKSSNEDNIDYAGEIAIQKWNKRYTKEGTEE